MSVTTLPTLPDLNHGLHQVVRQVGEIVVGKESAIQQCFACLLARGHLLIEDLPGVGKTTLAHALARNLGLQFQRIQFTSDLLPADILGVSIYERGKGDFSFHEGPIFAQMVLADEVNRATPKAQSALLEAMEEHQVTIEGKTRALPDPFFVIATQNPTHQLGTFPLPESQLDRFTMRITLGYPDPKAERLLLEGEDRRDLLERVRPGMDNRQLKECQGAVQHVHVSAEWLNYLQRLLAWSRESPLLRTGLSPRAGLALVRTSQAWALLQGRDFVLPEDLQEMLQPVAAHRLVASTEAGHTDGQALVTEMLKNVAVS
jgi:MoxR-like ATPase